MEESHELQIVLQVLPLPLLPGKLALLSLLKAQSQRGGF